MLLRDPLQQSNCITVKVHEFDDGTEQRYIDRKKYTSFTLNLKDLKAADIQLVSDFVDTVKGSFDGTWDITIDTVLYPNMVFSSPDFVVTEAKPNRFSTSLACHQTR